MPLVGSLSSRFDSVPAFFDASSGISVVASQGVIPCTSSYFGFVTSAAYDLTESELVIEVVSQPGEIGTRGFFVDLIINTANMIRMYDEGAVFAAETVTAGVRSTTNLGAYNVVSHRWWRIRHTGSTLNFDSSADRAVWSTLASKPTTFAVTALKISISAGYYGTEVSPPSALIDNLNPPSPPLARSYYPNASWLWDPIVASPELDARSPAWSASLASGNHGANLYQFGVTLRGPDNITAATPRYSITFTHETGQVPGDFGPNPFGAATMPIPLNTPLAPGSDMHLAIADSTTDKTYNLWQAAYNSGTDTWGAGWGALTPLSGDGRETFGGASTGARLARFGGVVRVSEIAAGLIEHALFFATDMAAVGVLRYPAAGTDGSNLSGSPTPIPEGARVQLDPSIDLSVIPGITSFELTVGHALQTYGAYCGDNGGARFSILCEFAGDTDPGLVYTDAGATYDYYEMPHLPWNSLRVLAAWDGSDPNVNLAVNTSFELDDNGDGRADGWGKFGTPTTTLDTTIKRSGAVSQKVVVAPGVSHDLRSVPIPIVDGIPYTLSVYVRTTALNVSPVGQIVLKLEWYDDGGTFINYDYTSLTTIDSDFVRRSVTSTPAVGAVVGRLILAIEGGGTAYFDDIQLEQASVASSYVEGPSAIPPIINIAANTRFEWDSNNDGLADGWSKVGTPTTTLDTVIKRSGLTAQKMVVPSSQSYSIRFVPISISAGDPYTLSVYVRVTSLDVSPFAQVVIRVEWLNSSGAVVNTSSTAINSVDADFVRRSVFSIPGSGSVFARIVLTVEQGGTVYFDSIQFEQKDMLSAYREPDIDWMVRGVFTPADPIGSAGAIGWSVDKVSIRPYEASFAALGFAAAYRAFGIQKFADIIWNWCAWYRDHMESDGTTYDYDIISGVLTKLTSRDSTDSYAGMYLLALRAANIVDPRSLTTFATSISKAVDAIELTLQPDGLTWAKPEFHAKYMQDQTETASGCFAAVALAGLVGNSALAVRALSMGQAMVAGIDALWNPSTPVTPAYDWAVSDVGVHDICVWSQYLHTLQQVWVVVFGVSDSSRSGALISQFLTSQPMWADHSITGRYDSLVVVALQLTGRAVAAREGLYLIADRAQSNNREWDFNPMKAGWGVIATLESADLLYDLPPPADSAVLPGTPSGDVLLIFSFWALYDNGSLRCPLPDVESWTVSPVANDAGTFTLTYPTSGINWSVLHESVTLDKDLTIQVRVNGVIMSELQSTLFESSGDDVEEGSVWTYTGTLAAGRLAEAIVAPQGGMPTQGDDPDTEQDAHFYSATAGTIFGTLMLEAQARGALTYMTYSSFSNTKDSNGVDWTKVITLKLAPGTDLLKVLLGLVETGMCEFRVVGFDVRLYQPDGTGVDRTLTNPPIVFRTGQSLLDSPRKHTSRDTATSALVAGADGNYRWASDASALARRGRRIEVGTSQGQIRDPNALTAYAAHYLTTVTSGRMEKTHGLTLSDGPVPFFDFTIGDWVWSDLGFGLERLRVAQITLSMDSSGSLSGSTTLNDLIAEREASLVKRMQGLEGGTTIVGTSTARPVDSGFDTLAPKAPQGVLVTSLAHPSPEPVPRSAAFASWSPVTTNSDNTPIEDLRGYVVQWRYLNPSLIDNWRQLAEVNTTAADWGDVIADEDIEVHVAAVDIIGNQSEWSISAFHTTQTDSTAPPIPSQPVVTEFLGTLTVFWDGLGSFGEVMPPDFAWVEIHRSTVSNFTPSSSTLADRILGKGSRNYTDLPLQVTQFFRLVAYDLTVPIPNISAPSVQASAIPAPVGYGDVAFSNPGNLVEDGSFELATSRATHSARSSPAWSFVSGGADHGTWFARATGSTGSGNRELILTPRITTTPGQQYAYRLAVRGTGVNGSLTARLRCYKSDATISDIIETYSAPDATGAWISKESTGTFIAPALTESFEVVLRLSSLTNSGTWDVDRVEVREMIGTLLVQNAAITNAKIATVSVGKLTAGTITAVMINAGSLKSAASGFRYELDANALAFYDADNIPTIYFNASTGLGLLTGTVQTGTIGRRVQISGTGNDIRFYPQIGETRYGRLYSYIPTAYPNDIAVELQAIDSDTATGIARLFLLPEEIGLVIATASGLPLTGRGGAVYVRPTEVIMEVRSSSGSGTVDGGKITSDNSGVFITCFKGTAPSAADRSTLQLADGFAHFMARDSEGFPLGYLSLLGSSSATLHTDGELLIEGNTSLTLKSTNRVRMKGWFGDHEFHAIDNDEAFFIGEYGFNSGFTELAISYGVTLLSLPVTVFSIGGDVRSNGLKSQLHTGFTVWWSGTSAGSLRFLCARM